MLGAVIGDIVDSRFEFSNHRSKDFDLFANECFFIDDTVMPLAVCDALMNAETGFNNLNATAAKSMQQI